MRIEIDEKLEKKYSILQNVPCGVSIPRGWSKIIEEFVQKVISAGLDKSLKIYQIKSKFGCLRIYASCGNEKDNELLGDLIIDAEKKANKSCEICGGPGKSHIDSHGWYYTLCEKHI